MFTSPVSAKGRNPVMRKHPQSCALAPALTILLHLVPQFLDFPQHIVSVTTNTTRI